MINNSLFVHVAKINFIRRKRRPLNWTAPKTVFLSRWPLGSRIQTNYRKNFFGGFSTKKFKKELFQQSVEQSVEQTAFFLAGGEVIYPL